jgi:ribonuclease BN (tRNA processing enzyme)
MNLPAHSTEGIHKVGTAKAIAGLLGGLAVLATAAGAADVGTGAAAPVAESAAAETTRLILLGTQGGPVSRGNRAQSANLLIVRGTPYLIDAGNGVARQLALVHVQPGQIHQIFITHNHDDHNADWGTLMGLGWSTGNTASTTVYGPVGTSSMLTGFLQYFAPNVAARYAEGVSAPPPPQIMHAQEIHGGLVYEDANIRVTAVENCHYHFPKGSPGEGQQSFALRFQTPDRVIVFSGDTGSCGDTLVNFAKGADLLVHEVINLPEIERLLPAGAPAAWRAAAMNHMRTEHSTPEEVGRVASAAGVKQVVLSHVVPGLATDSDALYTDGVRKLYSGPVTLGRDLQEF